VDDLPKAYNTSKIAEVSSPMDVPRRDEIVAALLKDHDRVLLCHRSPQREWYPNVWDLPGGHIDPGETPGQALVRELQEELGITIREPSQPPVAVIGAEDFRMQVWVIESWIGTPTNVAPEEHDDLTWADLDGASRLELAHVAYPALLAQTLAEPGDNEVPLPLTAI
jgi:mutator protein MutT